MRRRLTFLIPTAVTFVITISDVANSQNQNISLNQSTKIMRTLAQSRKENCLALNRTVKPSPQKRTVQLSQFGIKIDIPSNYRTLLRNNEVLILHPVDYDLIACNARGGEGGRGFYYQFVRSIPNPKRLSLRALVLEKYAANASIRPYNLANLNGLLVESPGQGFEASSLFAQIPSTGNIIEIGVGCDCDIKAKDVIDFVKVISLL
jgi:hypothetical protein